MSLPIAWRRRNYSSQATHDYREDVRVHCPKPRIYLLLSIFEKGYLQVGIAVGTRCQFPMSEETDALLSGVCGLKCKMPMEAEWGTHSQIMDIVVETSQDTKTPLRLQCGQLD